VSSQLYALCSQFLALIQRNIHAKCQINFKEVWNTRPGLSVQVTSTFSTYAVKLRLISELNKAYPLRKTLTWSTNSHRL